MEIKKLTYLLTCILVMAACEKQESFDASGAFEAEEIIISSETSGTIMELILDEGQDLVAGQFIGYVDSTQTFLKKRQLEAQINALLAKSPNISLQLASLKEQLKAMEKEKQRILNLRNSNAATEKQLDDIHTQIAVIQAQIQAQESSLQITTAGIKKDIISLEVQRELLNDQLHKHKIINPVNGTVITKYAETHETTAPGKPLYKIADLSTITLRAYISGNQLPQVSLKQKVKVLTDDGYGGYKQTEGLISWINDKAEFTPKNIQTKEERANRVYAVKVKVINDGTYKIGMYGELIFL